MQQRHEFETDSQVENAFFRYKSIIGDGLRARSPAGQGSEVPLPVDVMGVGDGRMLQAVAPGSSERLGREGGVIWEPWLLLFTALLPWPLLDHAASPAAVSNTAPLRAPHVLLLAALAGQQALVSVSAVEVKPLLSNYPMYAYTFESPEAFERSMYRKLQRLRFESGGAAVSARVQAIPNASEELLSTAENVAAGERIREQAMTSLLGVRKEYHTRYGVDLDFVTVTADRVTFDWQQGRFNPPTRVRIADVPLPDAGLGSR